MNEDKATYREDLLHTIEELRRAFHPYDVFRPIRLADRFEISELVPAYAGIGAQSAEPRLSEDELTFYVCMAMYEGGSLEETKRYLPRVFNHLARHPTEGFTECRVFSKLASYTWREWPQPEQAALSAYFAALWQARLSVRRHAGVRSSEPRSIWQIDVTLAALAQAFDDLTPYLNTWDSMCRESLAARGRMLEFIQAESARLETGSPSLRPWWKRREEQARQVLGWLLTPVHLEFVRRALQEQENIRSDERQWLTEAIDEFAQLCQIQGGGGSTRRAQGTVQFLK